MTTIYTDGFANHAAPKRLSAPRVGIIVPVLNAEKDVSRFLSALREQTFVADRFLVIDSSSTDHSVEMFRDFGAEVRVIPRVEFNHGKTRQLGIDILKDVEIAIFLTQDAVFAEPDSLERLMGVFSDPAVCVAYGRQLPRPGAGALESFVRIFNYPSVSEMRSFEDRKRFGFRTCHLSNSYSAYRVHALKAAGGFPDDLILGEDVAASANILLNGWKLAYVADSRVFHSHGYGPWIYFRRSFDIGVQHAQMEQTIKKFGAPEGMGIRYVLAELHYLLRSAPLLIPEAVGRNILRYIGYRLGRYYKSLPLQLVKKLSMHRGFWPGSAIKQQRN